MTTKKSKTVLCWIDLETTGLDENNGRILEYAVVLTDLELNIIAKRESVVPQNVSIAASLMDDYVTKMHEESGLLQALEEVEAGSLQYTDSIIEEEDSILAMLQVQKSRLDEPDIDTIFVIAGNTIGFDRRWIKKHMPQVEAFLHYRQLDVSSYKVGFPDIFGTATSIKHRAMDDILASIEQQRLMRAIVERGSYELGL